MPEPTLRPADDARVVLARAALDEVTDPADVGPLIGALVPDTGVVDLQFACTLAAYLDWRWVVSTSDLDGVEPTVLEVELLPGDGALLAPAWTPWADRLAEWRRVHPDDGPEVHDDEDDVDEEEDLDPEDVLDDVEVADDDGDEHDRGVDGDRAEHELDEDDLDENGGADPSPS